MRQSNIFCPNFTLYNHFEIVLEHFANLIYILKILVATGALHPFFIGIINLLQCAKTGWK